MDIDVIKAGANTSEIPEEPKGIKQQPEVDTTDILDNDVPLRIHLDPKKHKAIIKEEIVLMRAELARLNSQLTGTSLPPAIPAEDLIQSSNEMQKLEEKLEKTSTKIPEKPTATRSSLKATVKSFFAFRLGSTPSPLRRMATQFSKAMGLQLSKAALSEIKNKETAPPETATAEKPPTLNRSTSLKDRLEIAKANRATYENLTPELKAQIKELVDAKVQELKMDSGMDLLARNMLKHAAYRLANENQWNEDTIPSKLATDSKEWINVKNAISDDKMRASFTVKLNNLATDKQEQNFRTRNPNFKQDFKTFINTYLNPENLKKIMPNDDAPEDVKRNFTKKFESDYKTFNPMLETLKTLPNCWNEAIESVKKETNFPGKLEQGAIKSAMDSAYTEIVGKAKAAEINKMCQGLIEESSYLRRIYVYTAVMNAYPALVQKEPQYTPDVIISILAPYENQNKSLLTRVNYYNDKYGISDKADKQILPQETNYYMTKDPETKKNNDEKLKEIGQYLQLYQNALDAARKAVKQK